MSTRFFGFFAALWVVGALAGAYLGKAGPEVTHFSIIMFVVHIGFWSIMRKLDGKEPL